MNTQPNSVFKKISILAATLLALGRLSNSTRQLILRVRREHYTYLSLLRLSRIVKTIEQIEKKHLDGIFIEAGCALGGSAIVISASKNRSRALQLYDVFGQIPPPSDEDPPEVHQRYQTIDSGNSKGLGDDLYYGYQENLENKVLNNLSVFGYPPEQHNISTHAGLVQDQLNGKESVAFAHIDVDWYAPVKFCLEQIYPRLVVGGSIVLDDYNDWGGCKKATDLFLRENKGSYSLQYTKEALKITRIKEPQ
ncbi:MAG: TylF/MycF/NovP-related O-methyltransferase [Flavobacteriaceae bacterium]